MKSKFLSFILFVILIILVISISIFGYVIYRELFEDTESFSYKLSDISIEEPTEITNKVEKSEQTSITQKIQSVIKSTEETQSVPKYNEPIGSNFFYEQLNSNQKIIYNGLNENKKNLRQGNYVIKYGETFSELLKTETGGEVLGNDYQTAIEAFLHDNPDLFYLDVNKMYLNIETTTKLFTTTYNVYIASAKGSNYLNSDFTSKEQIESAIQSIEQIKDNIIAKLNGTEYQNIMFIHDYLVNNIEYDSSYQGVGSYSIYGALIEKKCVCEGYAKAFKYLSNSAGYECEMLQGTATNSSGQTESHAWNCVKLNGIWYQVDTTWDDPILMRKE